MQDFLLYSAIPGPDRSRPVPACPADSHCVIVYPPAIQIATLDLLNFIKNESWVPCKMQNGGMGAAEVISSLRGISPLVKLSVQGISLPAGWAVIGSLALPCLKAPLLRRGSNAAQGDGEHGVPPRFFRRARCPHRAVPGPSGVPLLPMGERSLIPYPARATARVAPTAFFAHVQSSASRRPRPTKREPLHGGRPQKLSLLFVGAGHWPPR